MAGVGRPSGIDTLHAKPSANDYAFEDCQEWCTKGKDRGRREHLHVLQVPRVRDMSAVIARAVECRVRRVPGAALALHNVIF